MTLRNHRAVRLAATAVFGLSILGANSAQAGCVMAGGEATMVTTDLAKFMSNAALKNSISAMGAKGVGQISMKCDEGVALTSCVAKQRACK